MGATTGDVSSHVVAQNVNDRNPVFSETAAAPVTKEKIQNTTGVCVDVYVPFTGKAVVKCKLYNAAKEEKQEIHALELAASTKGAYQFKLPPEWYFELVFTEGTAGKAIFQT